MKSSGRYIAALDVGTGSGRCILFDVEGKEVASAQREWMPTINARYPGAQDFDTRAAWQALSGTVHEALAKGGIDPHAIAAVTATSMREGMVLYDENHQVIWACPNADARAGAEVVEMVKRDLGRSIYEIGGDWLNIISPPRLRWIRNNMPDVYERIAHMTMLSDWVLFQLSGEFVTDPSIGSSSGMFDLSERNWSKRIVELADLPHGIYPPVYECGTEIGRVTKRAAQETGFAEGTPVLTGGADTQLALVGVGAVRPLTYTICGGTFWQTTVVTDHPAVDPEFRPRTLCHAVPGQWMAEGIGFYHGFTMRWFRDGFCEAEKEKAKNEGVDPYVLMERQAALAAPGANGIQPIFSNVMIARQWKHAPPSFVGFDILAPERSGKKECIRAIEENAAYVARGHAEILVDLTGSPPQEVIFCGGSAKGFLCPQILADVLGARVHIPVVKESTALGAAICAGIGLGMYQNWQEATECVVHWERWYDPQPQVHAQYDEFYQHWREVYGYMLKLADDKVMPGLWRAPGI